MRKIDEAILRAINFGVKAERERVMGDKELTSKSAKRVIKNCKQSIREVMLKTYKEAHKKREQGFSSLSEFFREFLDCLFGEK